MQKNSFCDGEKGVWGFSFSIFLFFPLSGGCCEMRGIAKDSALTFVGQFPARLAGMGMGNGPCFFGVAAAKKRKCYVKK